MNIKKNNNWLKKRKNDFYIKSAQLNKLRSRAWYKIREINNKYNIFKKNHKILEAGSNPGGWSQYIISKIGKGKLISFDKNEIKPMYNNFFLREIYLM